LKGIWVVSVIVSILILGVLASAPGAAAVPITFEFTGEVTGVNVESPPSEISALFSVGDQIFGTFTFDSLAPDTDGRSIVGTYAIDDFSVTVRFLDVTSAVSLVTFGAGPSSSGSITIFNNVGGNDEMVVSLNFPDPNFFFVLDDFSATVFDSDDLLLDPPDVSAFQAEFFQMIFSDIIVGGSITSLTLFTPDVTQAQLDAALAQRDAALADLNNLFTNNSCFPLAGTIQEVFDCITALIADLATAQGDLDAANTRIAELEAQLEELGQPGPPVSNQGQGKGVPAQGKNKP